VFVFAQNVPVGSDGVPIREASQIRATADRLIASGAPDDVAKGTALLAKALEIEQMQANVEKLTAEKEKLRRDLNQSQQGFWKDLVATFIPLASTVILAGTLIWQIAQGRAERRDRQSEALEESKRKEQERKEEREKNAAEAKQKEKERFMDALRDLWASEKVSTAAALIGTFREEPYRSWVLNTAITILLSRKTMDDFTDVFMDVMNPLSYQELPHMTRLFKEVDRSFFSVANRVWNEKTQSHDKDKLPPQDQERFDLYLNQQGFLSQKLAGLLHTPAPAGLRVDLSGLCLRDIDLSHVDLGEADISGTNWSFVNVDYADLSKISAFEGCNMHWTPWWHATRISKPLLEYLASNYPYVPGQEYCSKWTVNQQDYDICLTALRAA
jgi:uncharacterized protein YaiI (UPF0178 family)